MCLSKCASLGFEVGDNVRVCMMVCLDGGASSVVQNLIYLLFYLAAQLVCVCKLTAADFSLSHHPRHPPTGDGEVTGTGKGAKKPHAHTHTD